MKKHNKTYNLLARRIGLDFRMVFSNFYALASGFKNLVTRGSGVKPASFLQKNCDQDSLDIVGLKEVPVFEEQLVSF